MHHAGVPLLGTVDLKLTRAVDEKWLLPGTDNIKNSMVYSIYHLAVDTERCNPGNL